MLSADVLAQSGAVIPQGGAGHADSATCVILKRMGPADEITSHLYSFGFRGKQFQYVEGKFPEGYPFHGRLTDHDVRNLEARGTEVVVLNQTFTAQELKQARSDCRADTGKTPTQATEEAKTGAATATTATPTKSSADAGKDTTELSVSSTPSSADIELDGKFVESTPSSIAVGPGEHSVVVKKRGFETWKRTITTSGGHVSINAELDETSHATPASSTQVAIGQTQPPSPAVAPTTAAAAASPTPTPNARPATPEQNGSVPVSFTSDPVGADIFVDSKGVGTTPEQLQLTPGQHSVQIVKQGFKDWGTKLTVQSGTPTNVMVRLEK
jgi:hypothetical protein